MKTLRRTFLATMALGGMTMSRAASSGVILYVRYRHQGDTSYGVLDGDTIRQIDGDLFETRRETGKTVKLSEVKLLYPCEPRTVLAAGLNYKSHLAGSPAPKRPPMFLKSVSSLVGPGENIVIPPGAKNVHYEAELVIVIGKKARRVSVADAPDYIFGYTCGNDVSERDWQGTFLRALEDRIYLLEIHDGPAPDIQWWRAKASDTFAPLGPAIAVGLDYNKSRISCRLNGEEKQSQMVSDLIFGPPEIVSYASHYMTLVPGDVVFTGTPGSTSAMKPGDVVEVEIDGIGILKNTVTA